MTGSDDVSRTARALIRLAARLVPRAARTDWYEEWLSELRHEAVRRAAEGQSRRASAAALRSAALGAWRDALAMRA
ncbi:MAG TPA: hypothetical protein VFZ93_11030, partial [Albitalea sp.]